MLKRRNHTLKRALTDPRLISGIGNAYSDEILHRARLSPVTLTSRLTSDESARLFTAARDGAAECGCSGCASKARGEFPEQGDGVPRGDGRARPVRHAVPRLPNESAAHPLRRQRNQLLSALPDEWSLARRPLAVAAVEEGLAAIDRRAGANASVSVGARSGHASSCTPTWMRSTRPSSNSTIRGCAAGRCSWAPTARAASC